MSKPFKKEIKPVHPEFSRRMLQAADSNFQVPAPNEGRLRWFSEQFEERGHTVSMETVRKWFAGMTVPRQKLIVPLSEILRVDAGWLAVGAPAKDTEKVSRANAVALNGAVNIVAGFIQMDGGTAAFPNEGDRSAKENSVSLHAIIRGAKYDFHVALAIEDANGDLEFRVPVEASETIVLGVIREDGFAVSIYEIAWETIDQLGTVDRGAIVVPAVESEFREIKTFSERI